MIPPRTIRWTPEQFGQVKDAVETVDGAILGQTQLARKDRFSVNVARDVDVSDVPVVVDAVLSAVEEVGVQVAGFYTAAQEMDDETRTQLIIRMSDDGTVEEFDIPVQIGSGLYPAFEFAGARLEAGKRSGHITEGPDVTQAERVSELLVHAKLDAPNGRGGWTHKDKN